MNGKKLTKLNEMFGDSSESSKDENKVPIEKLVPFHKHPFRLYSGKRFDDMVTSIKEFGVLSPLLVRNIEFDKYEILSGHNRWNAAKIAGLVEVPVVVLEVESDDEAMLIVTETNLIQRSFKDMLPSERACVLAEHYEALKCQGKRTDLINELNELLNADELGADTNSGPVVQRLESREKVGENYELDGRTVSRYLRLNMLADKLKEFLDAGILCKRAGVEVSYLNEDNQSYLAGFLDSGKKIDTEKATTLHKLQKERKLNEVVMEKVLDGSYKPRKPKSILKGYKIDSKTMKRYFKENQSEKEVKEILEAALEMYFNAHQGGA